MVYLWLVLLYKITYFLRTGKILFLRGCDRPLREGGHCRNGKGVPGMFGRGHLFNVCQFSVVFSAGGQLAGTNITIRFQLLTS